MADTTLQPGEHLLAEVRLSWLFVLSSFGRLLGAILTLGLSAYLARRSHVLTITDRRLILRRGIVQHDVIEMELGRVAQVEVSSGPLDRLCGIGALKVIALDQFSFSLSPIPGPEAIKDRLMHAVGENRRTAPAGNTATASGPSTGQSKDDILAALEKLGALRDRGLVSPAEFEQKKREMLARL